jgi:hypothetical protein
MQMPWVVTPVLAAAFLAGCSLFAPEEKPEDTTPVAVEEPSPPTVSETQRQSDVDSCREQARAMVRQDENIAADIDSRNDQGAFFDESPDLTRNMDAFEAQQRYHQIFEDCMRGRGYVEEQPQQ